jgi:glycosyltransferase involved in cell wall biosynthesis
MKIIHFISSLGNGGAEKFVIDLSNAISQTDHEVVICSFRKIQPDMVFVNQISPNVKTVTFNKNDGFSFKLIFKLFSFLKKEKPAIVNSHLSSTIVYLYLPIILLRHFKAFHTVHCLAEEEEVRPFFRKLRFLFYKLKLITPISISDITDQSLKKLCRSVKSQVIFNGIATPKTTSEIKHVRKEIEQYKYDQNTKVFISVGRIDATRNQKNFDLMVAVFKKLFNEKENVILLIIGKDLSAEQFKQKELEKIKSANTFFLGTKNNVSDYLCLSDAFCMSSTIEGLPISILEAFATGLPVLSTPAGGIPDIIKHKVNGLLSKDFSFEFYYLMIKEFLLMDQNEITKIKKTNLSDFRDRFSIDKTCSNYLRLYEERYYDHRNRI